MRKKFLRTLTYLFLALAAFFTRPVAGILTNDGIRELESRQLTAARVLHGAWKMEFSQSVADCHGYPNVPENCNDAAARLARKVLSEVKRKTALWAAVTDVEREWSQLANSAGIVDKISSPWPRIEDRYREKCERCYGFDLHRPCCGEYYWYLSRERCRPFPDLDEPEIRTMWARRLALLEELEARERQEAEKNAARACKLAEEAEAQRVKLGRENREKEQRIANFPPTLDRANDGDAECQFKVGVAYYKGEGVAKNLLKAREYFEKSSSALSTSAAYMGLIYLNDQAGAYEEGPLHARRSAALMWYRRAIDLGGNYQADVDRILKEAREGGYFDKIR